MGTNHKRKAAQRKGVYSEWIAAAYLLLKGYRICSFRYRTKFGEIDIIARKGHTIAMIEVKARKDVWSAVNSVTSHSQRRIQNTADIWISRQYNSECLSVRFDIIAVCPWRIPVHIPDAF